jgi:hypothetical protein
VNQYSASASEIVSGALKDQKRAMIVGERTFGKGSVQMLFPLNERQAYLKLTTSHYYLPSGRCIHREENSQEWGVRPGRDGRDDARADASRHRRAAGSGHPPRHQLHAGREPAEKNEDIARAAQERVQPKLDDAKKTRRTCSPATPSWPPAVLLLRLQLAGAQI